jgi:hypothetical protein
MGMQTWVRRYAPMEVAGTAAALCAAYAAAQAGDADASVAAAWAECLAFYAVAGGRELAVQRRTGGSAPRLAGRTLRELVAEFGPAEAADSVLLRPLAMVAATALLGNLVAGVLAGKLLADAAFYALAIPAYEARVRAGR